MTKEYSPFTPGIPVPFDFFIGRQKEVKRLINSVKKSQELKTIERIFVTGERGIGKSSLCSVAIKIVEQTMPVLGLHVFLGGVDSLEEMIRRIFERLLKESVGKSWYESVKKYLGDHVKSVGLFDLSVEFDASEKELEKAVNDFVPALKNLLKHLEESKKAILLVLDDLNGLAKSERFAHWLKSLVDEIATGNEPIPLTLVLVGLPERRRELIRHQQSLDRVFDIIEIRKFNQKETDEFFEMAFGRVNVSVSKEAYKYFWQYSSGYPALMHEIGDSVFTVDTDNVISSDDALSGIVRAAYVIGSKYIEPNILAVIQSQKYRNILNKIPKQPFESGFSRKEIAKQLSDNEKKVIDNFLTKMKDLGVIESLGSGNYKFSRELYYLFFWLQALPEITIDEKE